MNQAISKEVGSMATRLRGISRRAIAAGIALIVGSQAWGAGKSPKISVGDDPSMKEGSPEVVLVEVSDFL